MIYHQAFFDLQWQFATQVARLADMPLAHVLLDYTNFYVRFGLGRTFLATDPVWCDYLDGLRRSATPCDWTYAFYRSRLPDLGVRGVIASVGCFSYERLGEDSIRLHFRHAETQDVSPLGAARAATRRSELHELFEAVRRTEGVAVRVIGNSWLYNLPAYRRIFPASYLASARPSPPRFRGMPWWGQFLDRSGGLQAATASTLLSRLSQQANALQLEACFPYQAISVEAPAFDFLPDPLAHPA